MKKTLRLLILLFLFHQSCFAQKQRQQKFDSEVDSLLSFLKTANEDTNKVNTLINLSYDFKMIYQSTHRNMPPNDSTSDYAKYMKEALALAMKINYKKGIAKIYDKQAGFGAFDFDNKKSLKYYLLELKVLEDIVKEFPNDIITKKKIASVYRICGDNEFQAGSDNKVALNKYLVSLKIYDELKDSCGMADCYSGIGDIYMEQNKYKESLKKYSFAEEIIRRNCDTLHVHFRVWLQKIQENKNTLFVLDAKESAQQAELKTQKLLRNSFIVGFAVMILFSGIFFFQRKRIIKEKKISDAERKISEEERKKSEELLLNILPYEVAQELKLTGQCRSKTYSMVTVMFADFKDFTNVSEKVSAELLVNEINYCFSAYDNILQQHRVEKIKTVGDAYICASGLPVLNYTHAIDLVTAAIEIRNFMIGRKKEKEAKGEIPFEIRIGIHTGPVVAGIVGVKKFAYDIWGDTVNIASRMESSGEAGKINISGSTYELVKDKFNCTHRGKIQAKNKGEIDMYFADAISYSK